MSVSYPKSTKFIEAVNKQCGFFKNWSNAYHDHGCYYDAGCCSKHDYMFEIEIADDWTADDTNRMKALIRKVSGGPVYGKQVKNQFGYHWLELHFDCSAKVLDTIEADNPEFRLWKKEQAAKGILPKGMAVPVFTAEELEIIDRKNKPEFYAKMTEDKKSTYRVAAENYGNYDTRYALRPVYKPIAFDKTDSERATKMSCMIGSDQRKHANLQIDKIKDPKKLERRYSACYEICGSDAPATLAFRDALYHSRSTMERI